MIISIIHHYLLWHYSKAYLEIFHVWTNFFKFAVIFFSIPQLLSSLFSPWKRMLEDRGQTFNFEDLAGFLVIGLISRIIGFVIRSIIVLIGLSVLLFLIISLCLVYFLWFLAPAFMIGSLIYGLALIFS